MSPSTPKHVLRRCISQLTREFVELREFTTLEKQLTCQGNHCCTRVSMISYAYNDTVIIYM